MVKREASLSAARNLGRSDAALRRDNPDSKRRSGASAVSTELRTASIFSPCCGVRVVRSTLSKCPAGSLPSMRKPNRVIMTKLKKPLRNMRDSFSSRV